MSDVIDPDILWPISFFAFFAICVFMFISVNIKTKWWRSGAGVNVFFLSGWFVFVMTLGVLGMIGVLPDWWRAWARFLVYTSGSLILLWRVVTIWYWNWHFWAWSKDGRSK
jgi:hypothetical protein